MCFMPALSPGHRFLAFLKDFPGYPGPVQITAEYIVYDLTRSAEYNRPHFKAVIHVALRQPETMKMLTAKKCRRPRTSRRGPRSPRD